MQSTQTHPRWLWISLGLAFATASTLALEITVTRLFSVILWYHYGFMAISLALLGVGLAGVAVYLYPELFPRERAAATTARCANLFAATSVAALLVFHWIVSVPGHWQTSMGAGTETTALGSGYRMLVFVVMAIPFFFAGLCVAIPLSRFTERIGLLYCADLVGAAAGALLVIPLISLLDGHPVVIVCAAFGCVAAICFSIGTPDRRGRTFALCTSLIF